MAQCGIDRIDALLASAVGASPLAAGDPDKPSVAIVQDLLTGHGEPGLPDLLDPSYGVFGPLTSKAVRGFRTKNKLADPEIVDTATLRALIDTPPRAPILSRAYLTLVLGLPFTSLAKILTVVSRMEGAGEFAALNLNTDRAGLSFGLLQWARKPGRLAELLTDFRAASPDQFEEIFGGSDIANRLLKHVQKTNGGISPASGQTIDPAFDLVREPWITRFRQAASSLTFQKVQVETAMASFRKSHDSLCQFAPELGSEQSVAFMLDLANQFGNEGARCIYRAVRRDGMTEAELLAAIATESVRRMPSEFRDATDARRRCLLSTDFFSSAPLTDPDSTDQPA